MAKRKTSRWSQFLAVRAGLIDELLDDGKTCTEVADILSMDPGQVWLINQRNGGDGRPVPDDARRAIMDGIEAAEEALREQRRQDRMG